MRWPIQFCTPALFDCGAGYDSGASGQLLLFAGVPNADYLPLFATGAASSWRANVMDENALANCFWRSSIQDKVRLEILSNMPEQSQVDIAYLNHPRAPGMN